MRRIHLFTAIALFIGVTACQTEPVDKQYFEEAPEIELAKKAVKAFQENDAEAYRSCFSDTVRMWHNQNWLTDPGSTIEDQMQTLEYIHATFEYYRYEDGVWEMIIQDAGAHWVHHWTIAHTKVIGDTVEIEVPMHLALMVEDNKIVYELGFFNMLPSYLAQQRVSEMSPE